ncbi:MAG: hypothetical protein H6Q72_964 [Firmicutes bacterium]|nr:hypothetical protein [Bacillota bacterium]
MCLPVISAVAELGSAISQSQASKQQAAIASQNAKLAEEQANEVQIQKQAELNQINDEKRQTMGTQRAAAAANGGDTSMGTGLGILTGTAYKAQEDKNDTEYNFELQSNAYRQQANDYRNAASIYKSNAKNQLYGGILGATGTYFSKLNPYKKANGAASASKSLKIPKYGSVAKSVYEW